MHNKKFTEPRLDPKFDAPNKSSSSLSKILLNLADGFFVAEGVVIGLSVGVFYEEYMKWPSLAILCF